jgi:glutathione S-transferase
LLLYLHPSLTSQPLVPALSKSTTLLSHLLIKMTPRLELFVLPGALYTRRVLIYVFEKRLLTLNLKGRELSSKFMKITNVKSTLSGKMIADGKPEGSVPLLVVKYEAREEGGEGEGEGEDKVVIGSLEIIQYFESIFSHDPLASISSMNSRTTEEKSKNILIEEATTCFEEAARKGSAMFAFLQKRDAEASRVSLERCRKVLGTINEYYLNNPHPTSQTSFTSSPTKGEVNISDIILFTLLQFAYIMYDIQLWSGLPELEHFYKCFEKRESVLVEGTEEEVWDKNLRIVASCWVGEGGAVWEWARVVGVLLRAVGGVVCGLVWRGRG